MHLETLLTNLTKALDANTAALQDAQSLQQLAMFKGDATPAANDPVAPEVNEVQSELPLEPEAPVEAPVDRDTLKAAFIALSKKPEATVAGATMPGTAAVKAIVGQFGVPSLSAIPDDQLDAAMKLVQAA